MSGPSDPQFGPSGYLPERAAKRARKIVLRAPLGLQWVVASVIAGLVVLAAGVLLLTRGGDPPGPPFEAVGAVEELGPVEPLGGLDARVVTVGGRIRVFADASGVDHCEASNRLEDGERVWSLTGRGLGTASLVEHPSVVHDGVLYVDPTRTVEGPAPAPEPVAPACG